MTRRPVVLAVIAAAAVVYPVVVLAGGAPHFPSRQECVHPARADAKVEAVFGEFQDRARAVRALHHVEDLGFRGLRVVRDGCGVLKIVLRGVPSIAVGEELVAEARRVGLEVKLQRDES